MPPRQRSNPTPPGGPRPGSESGSRPGSRPRLGRWPGTPSFALAAGVAFTRRLALTRTPVLALALAHGGCAPPAQAPTAAQIEAVREQQAGLARASIGDFVGLRRTQDPLAQSSARATIAGPSGREVDVWVAVDAVVLRADGVTAITGRITDEREARGEFGFNEEVTFTLDELTDWAIISADGEVVHGGYSYRTKGEGKKAAWPE